MIAAGRWKFSPTTTDTYTKQKGSEMRHYVTEAMPEFLAATEENDHRARMQAWEARLQDEAPATGAVAGDGGWGVPDENDQKNYLLRPGLSAEEVGGAPAELSGRELYMWRVAHRGVANGKRAPRADPPPPEGLSGRDLYMWRLQHQRLAGPSWGSDAGEDE